MRLLALGFALLSSLALGDADYALMQKFLGRYPIGEMNGITDVSGSLEIFANNEGLGFAVDKLKLEGESSNAQRMITPRATTHLYKDGEMLVQEHEAPGRKVRVQYRFTEYGLLSVIANVCTVNGGCELWVYNDSMDSVGKAMSTKTFFSDMNGKYLIELANGKKPKDANKIGEVSTEAAEGTLTFPYCEEQFCDPGYLFINFDRAQAYRKEISANHLVVTLVVTEDGVTSRYTWDNDKGVITFRNYQYRVNQNAWVMEYVMRKQ